MPESHPLICLIGTPISESVFVFVFVFVRAHCELHISSTSKSSAISKMIIYVDSDFSSGTSKSFAHIVSVSSGQRELHLKSERSIILILDT
jgi:hypothetical protein